MWDTVKLLRTNTTPKHCPGLVRHCEVTPHQQNTKTLSRACETLWSYSAPTQHQNIIQGLWDTVKLLRTNTTRDSHQHSTILQKHHSLYWICYEQFANAFIIFDSIIYISASSLLFSCGKCKGKVFNGQEPPSGEPTATSVVDYRK